MNPTASGCERAFECSTSCALPQVVASADDDAARGTSIHAFTDRVRNGMAIEQALAHVDPEWRETCSRLDWDKLGGDLSKLRTEVAYALSVEPFAAIEIGRNIGRRYPALGAFELAGTVDIEGVRIDGVPVVADIKTGQPVTPCAENFQIRFFAAVQQSLTDADTVEGRLLYIREDGSVHIDRHEFDRFELECYVDDLRDMLARVRAAEALVAAGTTPPVRTGDWCRYCPALPMCPAHVTLARAIGRDMDIELTSLMSKIAILTDEEAGLVYEKAKAVETVLELVLKSIRTRAKQRAVPLPNAKELRTIAFERLDFSQKAAIETLHAKGATKADIDACYRKARVEQVRPCNAPGAKLLKGKKKGKAA